MTRFHSTLTLTFMVAAALSAQSPSASDVITGCYPLTVEDGAPFHPPAFTDYPAASDLRRRQAPVDLTSHPLAPRFRTRLREAVENGPNFAGSFTIASWGCGSGCAQHAIVDGRNGKVVFPPQVGFVDLMRVAEPDRPMSYEDVRRRYFRLDSALLVVVGRPLAGRPLNGEEEGIFYYRWTGTELRLVRFLRSEKKWCVER